MKGIEIIPSKPISSPEQSTFKEEPMKEKSKLMCALREEEIKNLLTATDLLMDINWERQLRKMSGIYRLHMDDSELYIIDSKGNIFLNSQDLNEFLTKLSGFYAGFIQSIKTQECLEPEKPKDEIKMWIAKDWGGDSYLYYDKPVKQSYENSWQTPKDSTNSYFDVPKELVPEKLSTDEPMEVLVSIKLLEKYK